MNEKFIIKSINFILDKALHLDPQKLYLLKRLQKKSLTTYLNEFSIGCCFTPIEGRLIIDLTDNVNKENTLSANSGTLIAMAISANPQSYIQKGEAKYKGDPYVLEAYRNFFKALRPDLIFTITTGKTTLLSSFLSRPLDIINHRLNLIREKFPTELKEYVQYKKNLLPCKEELEEFFTSIQNLKQDFERITIKLEHYLSEHD